MRRRIGPVFDEAAVTQARVSQIDEGQRSSAPVAAVEPEGEEDAE